MVHHKEKEIVQSATITMNYVNRKEKEKSGVFSLAYKAKKPPTPPYY